jgi:hypothetical protein
VEGVRSRGRCRLGNQRHRQRSIDRGRLPGFEVGEPLHVGVETLPDSVRRRFHQSLYEAESTTLDFKKEQYRFAKATDEEKSELLKDILGFANAWRRSEAYILIGVEDVRGGRGNVFGIPAADHLDDHSLQQFVNSLTNRPVRFHYEAFGIEGKQVGIIRFVWCRKRNSRPSCGRGSATRSPRLATGLRLLHAQQAANVA